jgi:hypothetical protein
MPSFEHLGIRIIVSHQFFNDPFETVFGVTAAIVRLVRLIKTYNYRTVFIIKIVSGAVFIKYHCFYIYAMLYKQLALEEKKGRT